MWKVRCTNLIIFFVPMIWFSELVHVQTLNKKIIITSNILFVFNLTHQSNTNGNYNRKETRNGIQIFRKQVWLGVSLFSNVICSGIRVSVLSIGAWLTWGAQLDDDTAFGCMKGKKICKMIFDSFDSCLWCWMQFFW